MSAERTINQATLIDDSEMPTRVYHYTSTDGLLGILEGGQLRATDLRYLNDTSELHYGLAEMLRIYETVSQSPTRRESFVDQLAVLYGVENWQTVGPLKMTEVLALAREPFDAVSTAIVNSIGDSLLIGVACFCIEGDLLSQWRGYGIGGYALGFDAHELRGAVSQQYLPLTAVMYRRPGVRQALRSVSAQTAKLVETGSGQQPGLIQKTVTLPLLGFAAQIKHPTFTSEQEYRLGDAIFGNASGWKFRGGALGIVPYVDIDLRQTSTGRMPLREIYLAPAPEVALRETAVRALLLSKGYPLGGPEAVTVKSSSIPFRG